MTLNRFPVGTRLFSSPALSFLIMTFGVNEPGYEAEHYTQSRAKVQKEWSCMPIYLHYVVHKHKGNFGLKLSNIAQASRIVDLDSRRRLTERRSSRSGHFIPGKKVPASAGICVEIRLSWKEINRMNIENILTGEFRTPSQVGLFVILVQNTRTWFSTAFLRRKYGKWTKCK